MPIYVYRNLVTNETFEHEQRITEDALTVDPRTGDPVKRLIQPVGIAFKGSGFYVNDSRVASTRGAKSSSADASRTDMGAGSSSSSGSDAGSSGASSDAGAGSGQAVVHGRSPRVRNAPNKSVFPRSRE